MKKKGLSLQPFIIVVGPDLVDIEKFHVRVDSVVYEMPSLSRAVDILFKIFLTFNVSYAKESEDFCYFIQWAVYAYHTEADTKIPGICNLVNKIKLRL